MRIHHPLFVLGLFILSLTLALSGCTGVKRFAHMYSSAAPEPHRFVYPDGGSSTYYTFDVGAPSPLDTVVFFYGATGCPSWKSVMPDYVQGLTVSARVFALNKRFVADRSAGLLDCGRAFHLANNPEQWVADYAAFITAQTSLIIPKPKNVVVVGVSEAAWPASKVAGLVPAVTHLAIIGDGGYSMRTSLVTLMQKAGEAFDIDAAWEAIGTDPRSIEKNWYGNPYRWWTDVMDLDPLPNYLQLNIPILVAMGEKDESVPVESVHFLQEKFKEAGKNNLLVRIYPGADHRLSDDKGVSYRNDFFATLGRLLQAPLAFIQN